MDLKSRVTNVLNQLKHVDRTAVVNTIKNTDKKKLGYSCFFVVFLFLMCLEDLTKISLVDKFLNHIDELLVLALTAYVLLHIPYLWKTKRVLMCLWLSFIGVGFLGTVVYRYQGFVPTMIDAVAVVNKFMMAYIATFCYAKEHPKMSALSVLKAARIVSVILFVLGVYDLLLPTAFPEGEYRYFTNSLMLMFPHQTYLAAACATLLIYLGYTHRKQSTNIPYMLMVTLIGFMSLRAKSMAFFAVYWGLYLCMMVLRIRNLPAVLGGAGLFCFLLGYKQIHYYFLAPPEYSPRQIMLKDSIQIALDHFPLGTGFGTFGSSIAADNYSVLYQNLGYESNWGMGPGGMFLTDCFWPEIIAQFGYIGLILFVLVVLVLLKTSQNKMKQNRKAGFAMLMILLFMLINSIAESSFFNPTSMLLFMLFGLMEARNGKKRQFKELEQMAKTQRDPNAPKKILFVMPRFAPGGAEKSLLMLLHMLSKLQDVQVDLLLFKKEGIFLEQIPENINVLDTEISLKAAYSSFNLRNFRSVRTAALSLVRPVATAVAMALSKSYNSRSQIRWKYFYRYLLAPLPGHYDYACGYLDVEAVYYVVDKVSADKKFGWNQNDYLGMKVKPAIDDVYYSKLDQIITLSDECTAILSKVFPQHTEKMLQMPPIVTASYIESCAAAYEPEAFLGDIGVKLVSVGRLVQQKGFDMAIDAMALLKDRNLDVTWYIIGGGDLHQELSQRIEEKGVAGRVQLLGEMGNPYPYIKQADIFVQPSRYEGRSVILTETKMLAKPILATRYATAADQLTDGVNGILVDMDAESIADGIERLMQNRQLQDRLCAALRAEVAQASTVEESYWKLFELR